VLVTDVGARFDETCEKHVAILRLFHEAGGKYSKDPQFYYILEIRDTNLVRLLEIFAAAEREACAKECDAVSASADKAAVDGQYLIIRNGVEARRCAAAIRARSNA